MIHREKLLWGDCDQHACLFGNNSLAESMCEEEQLTERRGGRFDHVPALWKVLVGLMAAAGMAGVSLQIQGQEVAVTELMADNRSDFNDDDGDFSDWIEIQNRSSSPVNLAGWSLTDDPAQPDKWTFPELTIPAGAYWIVFASGKDRTSPGAPLHTNFQLDSDEGEYIALIHPDGTIVSELEFPPQQPDVAYGMGETPATEGILLSVPTEARALVPDSSLFGLDWTASDFDDSGWKQGTTGVGYDYGNLIGLDVGEMRNANGSVYVRVPFTLDEPAEFDRLRLRLQFEDGVIAYLDGEEVYRENAPSDAQWNSTALSGRDDNLARQWVGIDLTPQLSGLQQGSHVLAFHGLNRSLDSSDLLVRPELVGIEESDEPSQVGYLLKPTPRALNGAFVSGLAPPPRISEPSRTFTDGFTVSLSLPDATADSVIRYTRDGTRPTGQDSVYQGPVQISETTVLRARTFGPAGSASAVVSETYLQLDRRVTDFSSNLPLVVMENFGQGRPPQDPKQSAFMAIFEPLEGNRTTLSQAPHLATRTGIEVRGSSTAGRPKFSLGVEARNENDRDISIAPLGMPAESDWVLWGPYNFDRALVRNPLIYQLSREVGRYAVRTRFVEVFMNQDGGPVSDNDYFGVYALMEKITRDGDRVDVEELFVDHDRPPGVTGGYMLKIDRPDPGDNGFNAAGRQILYVDPKEMEIEQPQWSAQRAYLDDYFEQFGASLESGSSRRSQANFGQYLDIPAAIDHHLLNVLAFNVDALRLSTYFSKRRNGKIVFGPIWDFDRSMGSTDGRDDDPTVWRAQGGDRGTDFFNYPWWGDMFEDIDFFQQYIDRYQELRRRQFSVGHIHSLIDSMTDSLREAQQRDLDRWGQDPRFGGYQGEIDHIKDWYQDRINFMDSQFVDPPIMTPDAGRVTVDDTVTFSSPDGGSVFYTLDGSDPRRPGGEISTDALLYSEPIEIDGPVRITARALNPDHDALTGPDNPPLSSPWSGPVTGRFAIEPGPDAGALLVTEIHYHPSPPTEDELDENPAWTAEDFEYVELENRSDRTMDLAGLRFRRGIEFDFNQSTVWELDPGQRLLIVKDQNAFQARFPDAGQVAGVYSGQLGNDADELVLVDSNDQVVLRAGYRDDWQPATDGMGYSLVIVGSDASGTPSLFYTEPAHWRPSSTVGGSPGESDPDSPHATVWVNEILSNPSGPQVDTIELHNLSGAPVDTSDWFLTDDKAEPRKFQIPAGSVIPAGGYLLFEASQFNSDANALIPFGLGSEGEEVYLFSANGDGTMTGASAGFEFDAVPAGVTIGRYITSMGEQLFVPQSAATLGESNAGPLVPPVVLNEVMYAPVAYEQGNNTLDEYVELWNHSDSSILLGEGQDGAGWRVAGAVRFEFAPGTEISAASALLIVPFDPHYNPTRLARFRTVYSIPQSVAIVGPFIGNLDNAGETIRLERREMDTQGQPTPWMTMERLSYSPAWPWPGAANGNGASLQRISPQRFGNDPSNWIALDPTPASEIQLSESSDSDADGLPDLWESEHSLNPNIAVSGHGSDGDLDHDGKTNLEEWESGSHPRGADNRIEIEIESVEQTEGQFILRFQARAGQAYTVQYRDRLIDGEWLELQAFAPEATTRTVSASDPSETNRQRFYRIQAE